MSAFLSVLTQLSSATRLRISCHVPHIGGSFFASKSAGDVWSGVIFFFCSSLFSFAVVACTSEGCITSAHTNITTLEAPPASVEPPRVDSVSSTSLEVSWSKPLTQNGEVTEYVLKLNREQSYRGTNQSTVLSDLQPHTAYQLVLLACTSGGCTPSTPISVVTEEAPPTSLPAPTLKVNWPQRKKNQYNITIYSIMYSKTIHTKHARLFYIFDFALDRDLLQVTGPESLEISWAPPEHPNGVISGYELRRDGEVIYVGTEMRYHDFTLSPNVEYSYTLRANNSRGAASSAAASAKTHPSAPSGVGLPTLTPLGPDQVYPSTLPLLTDFTFIFQPVSCSWLFALPGESPVEFSSSP